MDITLSVNNREDVMVLPVTPSSFTISKPQGGNVFETVSQGELQLIGQPKLKGLTIEAFFRLKDTIIHICIIVICGVGNMLIRLMIG